MSQKVIKYDKERQMIDYEQRTKDKYLLSITFNLLPNIVRNG